MHKQKSKLKMAIKVMKNQFPVTLHDVLTCCKAHISTPQIFKTILLQLYSKSISDYKEVFSLKNLKRVSYFWIFRFSLKNQLWYRTHFSMMPHFTLNHVRKLVSICITHMKETLAMTVGVYLPCMQVSHQFIVGISSGKSFWVRTLTRV